MSFLLDPKFYHGHTFNLPLLGEVSLLLDLPDYDKNHDKDNIGNSREYINLAFTIFAIFGIFWIIEYTSRYLWGQIDSKFTKAEKSRIILGRHTMDVIAMTLLVYTGFEALVGFGQTGFMGFDAMTSDIVVNGKIAAAGSERIYAYSPAAQRLAVLQVAYEMKNFCDSIIHNDGIIFLAHHLVTGIVSAFALKPFLHLYACYFLGWSEISTVFLCVLVCFDDQHGIPGLNKAFPITMSIFGVLFAVSFTLFRIILWPYINYYFWSDMWIIYQDGTVHSNVIWWIYMVISVALTLLQLVWFKEIIQGAIDMFHNGGEIVIKRGDSDEISETADEKTTAVDVPTKATRSSKKAAASPAKRAASPAPAAKKRAQRSKSPAVRRRK
jgi:hypothetical protein